MCQHPQRVSENNKSNKVGHKLKFTSSAQMMVVLQSPKPKSPSSFVPQARSFLMLLLWMGCWCTPSLTKFAKLCNPSEDGDCPFGSNSGCVFPLGGVTHPPLHFRP